MVVTVAMVNHLQLVPGEPTITRTAPPISPIACRAPTGITAPDQV